MFKKNIPLLVLSVVLFLINSYIVSFYKMEYLLKARLVVVICFIPFFVYHKIYTQKYKLYIFLLLVFFEVFVLKMHDPIYSKIIIASRVVLYGLIIASIFKKIDFKIMGIAPVLVFFVIAFLNCYLLYMLIDSVSAGVLDFSHKTITVACVLMLVLACMAVANYTFNLYTTKSTLFLVFTYCLAFGDVVSFCGYYFNYLQLFYTERLLTFVSIYCFIKGATSVVREESRFSIIT